MAENKKRADKQNTIAGVLPLLLREMGWEKQLDLHSIFVGWREIVGEELYEHARPHKVERGVLWLEVDTSSWLQQLQFTKLDLLESLNRRLKLSTLRDIKMVLPKGRGFQQEEKPGPAVTFVPPSADKIAAFQRQVECIADEKCREALMQFWYLAEACKRETK
jgi:hypothetical protein